MQSQNAPTTPPGHIFNDSQADVVFSSSDGVNFKVHKLVLSLASDLFRDLFRIPQPLTSCTHESPATDPHARVDGDGLPIIGCPEPAKILDNLFRLCYPYQDPAFANIEEVRATLEAAMKYDMEEAISLVRGKLATYIPISPLRVYAIACCLDLEIEAKCAAREVRNQKTEREYIEEMEEMSAGAYQRLLDYCAEQGALAGVFDIALSHTSPTTIRAGLSHTTSGSAPSSEPGVESTPSKLAPYPYCMDDADLALVTSDRMEFRVSCLTIRLSSSVLASLIAAASSLDDAGDTTQRVVIPLPESSRLLSIVLQIIYPLEDPTLSDVDEVYSALAVAQKYCITKAIRFLVNALQPLCEDPVRLYFIACTFSLPAVAASAAKHTLRRDLGKLSYAELDSGRVSAGHLHRLLDYHTRIQAAARNAIRPSQFFQTEWHATLKPPGSRCTRAIPYGSNEGYFPCWFAPYMKCLDTLAWPCPTSATSDSLKETALQTATGYPSCSACLDHRSILALHKFSRHVAGRIEAAESEVTLNWRTMDS